ncbi:RHS repeat-associated core domain-containing protein [Listeria marthii]|nr:RHS repeat-associated core domain-containing protein [Listeria marthii]UHP13507.1 RHS repeat-associated core domain-containing protein [Listeria marthii]
MLKYNASTEEAKANPYGYAGYTYDKEIEQYYLMARYYEPEQGVFIAYDPDPGDEDDPQSMNGYNYANNNPVMYVDPDGHFAIVVPAVYWGVSAGIAAAPFVGYGIGKAGSWAYKNMQRQGKVYKTLWKYRKPIARKVYKTSRKIWNRTISKASGPKGRANRKKQGREVNERKRTGENGKKWIDRSNKKPNRPMKKHTPSKRHKGGKK